MKHYLKETEFATKSLIELISDDFNELTRLNENLVVMTTELDIKYQTFMANEYHPAANFYYAQMAQAFEKKEVLNKETNEKIEAVVMNIDAKSASITALSGALLQIAKQGISVTYGKPQNAPKGGDFNGILIKEIIWEARNQSNHYENPREISSKVVHIFSQLDKVRNDGLNWDVKSQVNFSFEVLRLLGWLDYEIYTEHMSSICPI